MHKIINIAIMHFTYFPLAGIVLNAFSDPLHDYAQNYDIIRRYANYKFFHTKTLVTIATSAI